MSSWLDKISNLFNFNNKNPECETKKKEENDKHEKNVKEENTRHTNALTNILACNPKGQQAEQDPARAQVMQDSVQPVAPVVQPVAPVVQDSAEDSVQQRPAEKIGGGKRKKSKKQRRSKRKNTKRNR